MKLIFECESELGRYEGDRLYGQIGADSGQWIALVHTSAATTSTNGMLRIEQRCYFRCADCPREVRPQPWVKPEMTLEPVLVCEKQTVEMVRSLHEQFLDNARQAFLEQSLVAAVPAVDGRPQADLETHLLRAAAERESHLHLRSSDSRTSAN
jgi:hypothetical protein